MLSRAARLRFGKNVVAALADENPVALAGLTHAEVAHRLDVALACAERYRLRIARDLRSFLRMCFLIAPDFSDSAPFSALLKAHGGQMQPLFDLSVHAWRRAMIESVVRGCARAPASHPVQARAAREATLPVLVPLSLSHEQAWWQHRLHPDVWRLSDASPLLNLDAARHHLRHLLAARCEHVAIVSRDHAFIGALLVAPHVEGALLSYWIRRDLWGLGFASEAIRQLVLQRSGEGKHVRLNAVVHPSNTPSERVLQKAGFVIIDHGVPMQSERIYRYGKGEEHG